MRHYKTCCALATPGRDSWTSAARFCAEVLPLSSDHDHRLTRVKNSQDLGWTAGASEWGRRLFCTSVGGWPNTVALDHQDEFFICYEKAWQLPCESWLPRVVTNGKTIWSWQVHNGYCGLRRFAWQGHVIKMGNVPENTGLFKQLGFWNCAGASDGIYVPILYLATSANSGVHWKNGFLLNGEGSLRGLL